MDIDFENLSIIELAGLAATGRDATTELKVREASALNAITLIQGALGEGAKIVHLHLEDESLEHPVVVSGRDGAKLNPETGYPDNEFEFSELQMAEVIEWADENGGDAIAARHFQLSNHWVIKRFRDKVEGQ